MDVLIPLLASHVFQPLALLIRILIEFLDWVLWRSDCLFSPRPQILVIGSGQISPILYISSDNQW